MKMYIDEFARTIKIASPYAVQNFVECFDDYIQETHGDGFAGEIFWDEEYKNWYYENYNCGNLDSEDEYLRSIKYNMPQKKWGQFWKSYYKKYFLDEGER
jgi:hypothetical protein